MPRPAPIRLAGMIVATATFATLATESVAQSRPQDSRILNEQLQLGDVIAGQTLNVIDGCCVTATSTAQGNAVTGVVTGGGYQLDSTQDMQGDATASATLTLGGDTRGRVRVGVQADGNALVAGAEDADLTVDARQTVGSGRVSASSLITGSEARLLGGAQIGVGATANTMTLGGHNGRIDGQVEQTSDAVVTSENFVGSRYIPNTAEFHSQAVVNSFQAHSTGVSDQDLEVRQRSDGSFVQAGTSANAANAWDLAGRANAAANRAQMINNGGAQVLRTDQASSSTVRAASVVTAYQFGAAESVAEAVGNSVMAGNNDIHFQIDNTQFNSGGVSAEASFAGAPGYDVDMGAGAAGNSVTGYTCGSCQGYIDATNSQVNTGDVSATINGTASIGARSVISGANAVGNSATFYVSRPGN